MIMNDQITSKERLTFEPANINDFYEHECVGCGRTSEDIVIEDECTFEELDRYSKTTDSGLWYCHADCYRDSH